MFIASSISGMLQLFSILFAQDPFVVAPHAYKHQFENDRVRVVRAHYEPREKIASHDHPKNATVYVYLRDSGPVRFKHTGQETFVADRPAVKAGGFRLGRAVSETHEVESLSDQPTDFLRVELKMRMPDDKSFRGRFPPDAHRAGKSSERVRFENAQVRIARITCAKGDWCNGSSRGLLPSLLVAITPARLKIVRSSGASEQLSAEAGRTIWVEPNEKIRLENVGNKAVEILRIEMKTNPLM